MFYPRLGGGTSGGTPPGGPPSAGADTTPPGARSSVPQDISGRFDSSALERGAKALRELDASPNAAKAFEVTKMQETTRQKEIARDIEQAATHRLQIQAERTRIEAEEKRKTVTHQQEQERITAQYKAQLEAEAYAKKLQDQKKQNQEWLNHQHQQFLRQEEIRKRNEKELLDMKRQQMQEEKQLEQEIMRAKIQEETRGKIQQERENADIHLRELRARAAESRKTQLEVVNSALSSIGGAMNALLEDKRKRNALVRCCQHLVHAYAATHAGARGDRARRRDLQCPYRRGRRREVY